MKILHDARYLAPEYSGIRTYSEGLLRALAAVDAGNSHTVLAREGYSPSKDLSRFFKFLHFPAAPVSMRTLLSLNRRIEAERPDVLHSHYPIIPLQFRGRLVVTVHDLQPLLMPEWTGGRPWAVKKAYDAFYRWHYPLAFERAQRLVCVSEYVRQSLAQLKPAYAQKAIVTYEAPAPEMLQAPDPQTIERLRKTHGLPENYALFIGSTRPNKNLPRMLEAFARMRRIRPRNEELALVLILSVDRFFTQAQAVIEREKIGRNVIVLSQCNGGDIRALYRNARGLFFPTLHEGFGLPVLEAQAQGTPVLASTSGALPEVSGGGALLVNPLDVEEMSQGMDRLVNNDETRLELIEKGKRNLERFVGTKHAQLTMQAYQLTD